MSFCRWQGATGASAGASGRSPEIFWRNAAREHSQRMHLLVGRGCINSWFRVVDTWYNKKRWPERRRKKGHLTSEEGG
jgi:hypothetical protein